jgi:hypothetical protein
VNLEEQYMELTSNFYSDDDEGRQDLGHLTSTGYIMGGNVTRTTTGYTLQLWITETANKMTAASYSGTCTFLELDNLTGIRRASLDLLQKMGVTLTAQAKTALAGAATTNHVHAQTALAQGIVAQRQGTEVAALSYFFQAAEFDPSLLEAVNRSTGISANVSSGNIGANIRNEIAWRRSWVAKLKETEESFHKMINATPPYTLYYSTYIKEGPINHKDETADLAIRVNLKTNEEWFTATRRVIQTILDGLNTTQKKKTWELANWPTANVSKPIITRHDYDIVVVFELVNEEGKVIGAQTATYKPSFRLFHDRNDKITVTYPEDTHGSVTFNAVNANDISDNLVIRIASVNGLSPEAARFAINTTTDEEISQELRKLQARQTRAKLKSMASGGIGGFVESNFGGGIAWSEREEKITMPYNNAGIYLFFDATYIEATLSLSSGSGKWKSNNTTNPDHLPNMSRTCINFGLFGRLPIESGVFVLAGIEYEASISGNLSYSFGNEYPFDGNNQRYKGSDLSALWFKFGGGLDVDISQKTHLRLELLYGMRTANTLEIGEAERFADTGAKTNTGHGLGFKAGIGFKL